MAIVGLRLFMFSLLPVLLTWTIVLIDRTANSRRRKLEILLIFLFAISVAGNGIFSFFAHFFVSDVVAASIGWAAGSPFQLEVGFANLALGVLGIVATGRRDGFREATVLAVTIFAVGATIVHFMDMAATGNLAPGNSLQNVGNLARPTLLIWALWASRRTESSPLTETDRVEFDRWRMPLVRASGPLTIAISVGYGVGFALGQPWLITFLGAAAGVVLVLVELTRSPWHDLVWGSRVKGNG